LQELLSFQEAYFCPYFRGLLVRCSNAICGRDGFRRNFGRNRHENLSGAISWLTFLRAEQRTPGELKAIVRGAKAGARKFTRRWIGDLFSEKAEELSLFGPVCRQPRRQAHQCLGGELRGFSAIDDGRGDVGRQPRKTQEGVEVGSRHVFFASDVMHRQLGVLAQAGLDVMRAGNDSEQAGIGWCLTIGILDHHSHFATYAL
jgi:hypothetical protein